MFTFISWLSCYVEGYQFPCPPTNILSPVGINPHNIVPIFCIFITPVMCKLSWHSLYSDGPRFSIFGWHTCCEWGTLWIFFFEENAMTMSAKGHDCFFPYHFHFTVDYILLFNTTYTELHLTQPLTKQKDKYTFGYFCTCTHKMKSGDSSDHWMQILKQIKYSRVSCVVTLCSSRESSSCSASSLFLLNSCPAINAQLPCTCYY